MLVVASKVLAVVMESVVEVVEPMGEDGVVMVVAVVLADLCILMCRGECGQVVVIDVQNRLTQRPVYPGKRAIWGSKYSVFKAGLFSLSKRSLLLRELESSTRGTIEMSDSSSIAAIFILV